MIDEKKLIERLEELYNRNDKSKKEAYEEQDWERFDFFTHRNEGIYSAISIVNQLAEEYLPETNVGDMDGWSPCSERLPSREEVEEWATFLVTIRVHGKYDIMDFCLFGTDGKWHISGGREVIAWKRQMPYRPKGE